jgi:hypothetical protein
MFHPTTMRMLADDRRVRMEQEAARERLVRAARASSRQEPRERFSVRDLRWLLFRPAGV